MSAVGAEQLSKDTTAPSLAVRLAGRLRCCAKYRRGGGRGGAAALSTPGGHELSGEALVRSWATP